MALRHKLNQAYSKSPQRIESYMGLLSREEIYRLRFQYDITIVATAEDAGRLTKISAFQIPWRKYLLRWGVVLKPILNSLTSRGNQHGP